MNDSMRIQLAEYLDGRLTPEARRRVESVLSRDPAARAELDALREFNGLLDSAAPAAVTAPPELRARIMERVHGGAGPAGPSGAGLGTAVKSVLVVGAVMAGVVGALMVADSRRAQAPLKLQAPSAPQDLAPSAESKPAAADDPGRAAAQPRPDELQPLSARDTESILGATRGAGSGAGGPGAAQSAATRLGRVFTFGQGSARGAEPAAAPGVIAVAGAREDVSRLPAAAPAAQLESAAGWTAERLRTAKLAATPAEARERLELARRYNLNPGLLAAVARDFPERGALELAMAMRASLNATRGLERSRRLDRLAADLGGKPERAVRWTEAMQE